MSHFPAPIPGAPSKTIDEYESQVLNNLLRLLRCIEDSVDRIDAPVVITTDFVHDNRYWSDQLRRIVQWASDAQGACCALAAIKAARDFAAIPTPEEQAAILDAVDDVVLPCEGGEA